MGRLFSALAILVLVAAPTPRVAARDLDATPATLDEVLGTLAPGDTVHLAAGTYGHFTLTDVVGTASAPITLEGPADLGAVVRADDGPCCNTIQIDGNVSYVVLRHLTIDGHGVEGAFGVDARGPDVHHVTIEGCTFVGHDASQQTVAISTKTPTAGWVIRGNRILGAGTGMYLGNSDGTDPFVDGLIENNFFFDTIGYCVQIKWQLPHEVVPGCSAGPSRTIVRHNVFLKADRPSPDGDRPSLLVGGFPESGPNADDTVQIYGNLFVHNPREALLQASGRVSIHDNVFLDTPVAAIRVADHDLPLRRAWIYDNTIHVAGTGVSVGTAAEGTWLVGNAIFASPPVTGSPDTMRDNVAASPDQAAASVVSPSTMLASADYHPQAGQLLGAPLDASPFASDLDYDLDFDCRPRGDFTVRGAYVAPATPSAWHLAADVPTTSCGSPLPPPRDGGVAPDAGQDRDASAGDGGAAATAPAGCSCRVGAGAPTTGLALVALVLLAAAGRRRWR